MNIEREKKVLKEIITAVNNEKYGMRRFLQATPYVEHDYFSFNGVINEEVFYEHLYYESKSIENKKQELYDSIVTDSGINTFFILGYQGCGKTTFINALLNYYTFKSKKKLNQDYLIDCDKNGVNGEETPLKIIFSKKLLSYIIRHNDIIYDYTDFYNVNHLVLRECVNSTSLYSVTNYFTKLIDKKESLDKIEVINELELFLSNLDIKDSLYIIILFYISKLYKLDNRLEDSVFLFIDNLDYIDNLKELAIFMNAIKSLTTDMSKIFNKLRLYEKDSSISSIRFTNKVKILVAMRETTYANLPNPHEVDFFDSIHSYCDITEWYNKNKIVDWRLKFLKNGNLLSEKKKGEANLILEIIRDNYTKDIFIPLYNNNYRRATKIITTVIIDHPKEFDSYDKLAKSKLLYLKHGARGILFKLVMDLFNSDENGEENCLRKIGVLDFQNRKSNDVSIARMILSYLSTMTDTLCDNPRRCVSVKKIIDNFDGIFTSNEIIRSLLNMYSLKDSIWTHLVSFGRYESSESIKEMLDKDDYSALDLNKTTVHYSCAGKIYLEVMTSHFEFFSTRIKGSQYPALFCYSNYKNGSKKFLDIIESVIHEVELCCNSLSTHNEKVCNSKGKTNIPMDIEEYLKSPFVASIKKINRVDKKRTQIRKQFHEDRIINSHIGYIDRFRMYIINNGKRFSQDSIAINESLCNVLERYIKLLDSVLITEYTKETLLPFYKTQLETIRETGYKNCNIPIKKDI